MWRHSLFYGAFGACELPGTSCRAVALGHTWPAFTALRHGNAGTKRLGKSSSGYSQPRRFASVGALRAWVESGGAAEWRSSEAARVEARHAGRLMVLAASTANRTATETGVHGGAGEIRWAQPRDMRPNAV